jgi:hypothetical protein
MKITPSHFSIAVDLADDKSLEIRRAYKAAVPLDEPESTDGKHLHELGNTVAGNRYHRRSVASQPGLLKIALHLDPGRFASNRLKG